MEYLLDTNILTAILKKNQTVLGHQSSVISHQLSVIIFTTEVRQ